MAFTDNSDLFGSVHENGINLAVNHIMRKRPSLFNYGTALFLSRPDLLCVKIKPHPWVLQRGNPLITVEDPLPLLGTDGVFGLNFCAQLTEVQVDFHPGNFITLPPELRSLGAQQFAFHVRACGGIGCPSKELINRITLLQPQPEEHKTPRIVGQPTGERPKPNDDRPRLPPRPLPMDRLDCFCLDLFAVCHFEIIGPSGNQRLIGRLDGLEIADIKPDGLEYSIECYLSALVQLVLLPRLSVLIDTFVFDIPVAGITNATVMVSATPTSAAVPNNPAVESDQLKVLIDVEVT